MWTLCNEMYMGPAKAKVFYDIKQKFDPSRLMNDQVREHSSVELCGPHIAISPAMLLSSKQPADERPGRREHRHYGARHAEYFCFL